MTVVACRSPRAAAAAASGQRVHKRALLRQETHAGPILCWLFLFVACRLWAATSSPPPSPWTSSLSHNNRHHKPSETTTSTTTTTKRTTETGKNPHATAAVSVQPPSQDATTTTASQVPFRNLNVPIYSTNEFWLLRRLGYGKFSEVFEAIHQDKTHPEDESITERDLVVVKCLKAVSQRKIRREVEMLMHISELPNMTKLLGVVLAPSTDGNDEEEKDDDVLRLQPPVMPALLLQHAGRECGWLSHYPPSSGGLAHNNNHKEKDHPADDTDVNVDWPPLSEWEIKYYLLHLLIALDALHSRGIMHRDVKPRNVLVSRRLPQQRGLILIDFGLAQHMGPGPFHVRVASRHYKAPELLLGFEHYNCAIDMWGVGCILASLLFHREPFFRGRDNLDQLGKIATLLGTDDLRDYCRSLGWVALPPPVAAIVQQYEERYQKRYATSIRRRQSWSALAATAGNNNNKTSLSSLSANACDLLNGLLQYNHRQRWTARQAMAHAFFDEVREEVWREVVAQQQQQQQQQKRAQSVAKATTSTTTDPSRHGSHHTSSMSGGSHHTSSMSASASTLSSPSSSSSSF